MLTLIDFETTGLLKPGRDFLEQPGIMQIGAVKVNDALEEVASFKCLVNPEKICEEGAAKTHGITSDMIRNEPSFFAIFSGFAAFVEGSTTWGGYNIKFDKDVLFYQLQRYGFEKNFPWPRHDLDVMDIVTRRQGSRMKLVSIYKELFNKNFDAHDALEDIRATLAVLKELQ